MAITTADQWFGAARQKVLLARFAGVTSLGGITYSTWAIVGNPGAGTLAVGNTTTGVLFTSATAGAPGLVPFSSGATGYLAQTVYKSTAASGASLYDRIWGAGAISLTSLGTTTFSSQPSALGRFPDGAGVGAEILLEIATTVSATATTFSVGYTNSDGVSGRVTSAASINAWTTPRVTSFPLQAGDKGVQKIDSVTVGGTVATAGAANVLLARRLDDFNIRINNSGEVHGWDMTGAPVVYDSSCFWNVVSPDSTSTGAPIMLFTIING